MKQTADGIYIGLEGQYELWGFFLNKTGQVKPALDKYLTAYYLELNGAEYDYEGDMELVFQIDLDKETDLVGKVAEIINENNIEYSDTTSYIKSAIEEFNKRGFPITSEQFFQVVKDKFYSS